MIWNKAIGLLAYLVVVAGPLADRSAPGQCAYDVAIISGPECPPFGEPPTRGVGVNEDGVVVGFYSVCTIGPDQAYVWTAESGLVTLDIPGASESKAQDISGDCIVGTFNVPNDGFNNIAFLRDGSELTVISPPEGTFSVATAVSDLNGIVVGSTALGGFVWKDGDLTTIGPFGPGAAEPRDVNDAGQVVGWAGDFSPSNTTVRGFIWEEGEVTMLDAVPGGVTSVASAINNRGEVAGSGKLPAPDGDELVTRAYLWTGGAVIDLGALPAYDRCAGLDINDHGAVVGDCNDDDKLNTAFLWQKGSMWQLDALIDAESALLIRRVGAINNRGQITGWGTIPGATVAFLLTPIDPPLGDLDIDCEVGITDFLRLLGAWGPCLVDGDCPADLSGDGAVDWWDFSILVQNWG
jgi:probable HAF family extracellular repeat protein